MSRIQGIQILVPLVIISNICMKKKTQKDKKIRKLFNRQELKYVILKSIVKNENLSLTVK